MDPVYAWSIAGLTVFFFLFVCTLGIFTYLECRANQTPDADYEAVES
jgi:hypothetical protein